MDVSPSGNGIIRVNESAPTSYPFIDNFSEGTSVKLNAVPATGYLFNNWSGSLSGTDNPTTILIDCNKSITANFSPIMHTLNIHFSGNGSTNPAPGNHDYMEGIAVSITANPASGWQFDSWTGNVADPSSATTTITIDSDKTATASFSQITTMQVNWPLIGGIIGGLALVGALAVIIIRRRAS